MPSKKKKYNARFPAGRIKKIMQSDEEVGKVAQAVPIIISRTLELFVKSLLTKTLRITNSRNAKTLSPSHMKQCIMSESRFDFLRELVKNIPDISIAEEACPENSPTGQISSPSLDSSMQPFDLSIKPSTSNNDYSNDGSGSTTNGNNQNGLIRDLGRSLHSTTITIKPSSPLSSTTSNTSIEFRTELKRQWDNVHACRKQHLDKNSAIAAASGLYGKDSSVIQHTSDKYECSVPKVARMESLPTTHERTSIRKLQHQSKSVPCSSKEAYQLPIVPVPIISADICNKPVVKIDYSNLALHDSDLSPDHNNSINPVINIDLSNITSSTVSPFSKATSLSSLSVETAAATASLMMQRQQPPKNSKSNSQSSNLELDEDYDNI